MRPSERSTESWTDMALDAALRDVAVPAGLVERLRPETLFDDRAVDRILGDVPMPAGLAARLWPRDAAPRMPSMDPRPGPPARRRRPRRWLRAIARDGLAVGLAIGVVATMFIVGLRVAEWSQGPGRARARSAPANGPRSIAEGAGRAPGQHHGDDSLATDLSGQPPDDAGDVPASPRAPAESIRARSRPPSLRAAPLPLSGETKPAAGGRFPGMQVVPDESPGDTATFRRSVPGMRGFDLAFEMAHGEAPFVDPSVAPGLAVHHPPLVFATDSFDRVWPLPAGRQRRAELASLRVEHLFAALSARALAAETDEPTVGLAAVRSLRPGRPTYLVEVYAEAPTVNGVAAEIVPPGDATLVLDHSAAPGAMPLWLSACRGLAAAAARMTPLDRLTVVVAEPRPRAVAIRAGADDIRRLATELAGEPPFGIADLDAAVALARDLTDREAASDRLIVVAHSVGADRCVGAGREALNRWSEAVRRDDASIAVPRFLLVSGVPDGSSAAVAGMPGWTLSAPTTLRRRLVDLLATTPPARLERAALEVRFDPVAIAAYRLVGHRQSVPESLSAFGGRSPADSEVTIHAGETARAVYEVVPRQPPRGRLDGITATLTCRDPSGAVHSVTTSTAALDPAAGGLPSAAGCELVLAVAVGEFSGRSIHAVPKRAAVEGVRGIVDPWERRGDVSALGRRLIELFGDLAAGGGPSSAR